MLSTRPPSAIYPLGFRKVEDRSSGSVSGEYLQIKGVQHPSRMLQAESVVTTTLQPWLADISKLFR